MACIYLDLFEERCAQIEGLRNCHQYQQQQYPSVLFLLLQPNSNADYPRIQATYIQNEK